MNVLVVGAGAVGQVIGASVRRGGAKTSFLVKPEHAPSVRNGFTLYRHRPLRRSVREVREQGFDALCEVSAAAGQRWDAVVLCVGSPALRDGSWLGALAQATGQAPVLAFAPGLEDPDRLAEHLGPERVAPGMFGVLAYAAPLGTAPLPRPGTAFWVPPGSGIRFASELAAPVVEALRRGGLQAAIDTQTPSKVAFAGALLDPMVAGLECADWRLRRLTGDRELLGLVRQAAGEAGAIVAGHLGKPPPSTPFLLHAFPSGVAVAVATRLAPLDLEAYLRAHYTKVGAQTRLALETFRRLGRDAARPVGAVEALLEGLKARDRGDTSDAAPTVLDPSRARHLRKQAPRKIDPTRSVAVKRNVHDFEITADAADFARAFEEVLAEPSGAIGSFQLRRSGDRRGRNFEVGEQFQGCFSPRLALQGLSRKFAWGMPLATELAAGPAGRWVEDTLLSDYAQVVRRSDDPETGFRVAYEYLPGTPFAGSSTLRVSPAGAGRCRFRAVFEFQEDNLPAVVALHLFGIRAHDRLVVEQVRRAAERVGATVAATTAR